MNIRSLVQTKLWQYGYRAINASKLADYDILVNEQYSLIVTTEVPPLPLSHDFVAIVSNNRIKFGRQVNNTLVLEKSPKAVIPHYAKSPTGTDQKDNA